MAGLTWNWVPMLQRNKAVAGFDRTHNLQFYGNYELPFGPRQEVGQQRDCSRRWPGGWQTNWILSRMSGTPFTVGHVGHVGERAGQYADGGSDPGRRDDSGRARRRASHTSIRSPSRPVTDVRFGTSGRNILRGPGVFNLDGSVFRNFKMTERFKLQVRAEMFGVTNTPQFGNPGATASNMTRNADGSVRALNGYTEITGASGERQIRFALKLTF